MLKKKLAAVCAVIMTMGVMSAAVSAEVVQAKAADSAVSKSADSTADKAMTEAITKVKSRVKIPESYSDFSYSVSQNQGMKSYSFNWKHPKFDDNGYSVTITGDIITQYLKPNAYYNSGKAAIGPYSAEDYEKLAIDWVNGINPMMKGLLYRKGNVSMSINNDNVIMVFNRINDGVELSDTGNKVSVCLDKKTGEVIRMHADGWWQGAKFEAASKAMTAEEIYKIYSEEVKLKPWYRIRWYKNKKVATIVYEPMEISPEYNAVTGEHSTREEDRRRLSNTDLYEDVVDEYDDAVEAGVALDMGEGAAETEVAVPAMNLSEEETKAVKELKGMLTAAKFKKLMIDDPYIKITDSYLTDSFDIYKSDEAACGYMIRCAFKIDNKKESCTYHITADAKSGKVYGFYRYGGTESTDIISPAKASKLGTEAARYYYGDIFDGYKADTENSAPARNSGNGYRESQRAIRFYRYVNGIQVDGDQINITVNSAGEVTRASFNHTTDVDFGDGKIISKETALSKLYEQRQPALSYMGFTDPKSNPHTYLTYKMPNWRINAKTGKLCNYDGSNYEEKAETAEVCPYNDIASSPYKAEIETLYNYGIRIFPGDSFEPKANITSRELENIFNAMLGYGISYYHDPYGEEVDIVEEDIAEEGLPAGAITNRQLAKRFAAKMRAEDYAKMKGIYKSPFSDVSDNDPDIGYICLAYGFGAVTGENGRLNPDAPVTREYAMHCVYNYIKKQS